MPLNMLADPNEVMTRPEPIRLRTLVHVRWVAIAGQIAAMLAAWMVGVQVPLLAMLVLIGVAALLNIWLSTRPLPRISSREAALQMLFDLVQLAALLSLTGGLSNPFALLVLAPVTVAATVLPQRETVALGAATVVMISLAAWFGRPLYDIRGTELEMPWLLALAHWVAIVIGVVFFATYAHRVASEFTATADALFATRMALAREQKLQHLGGVVAAAAHEMGTPLATMKLISSELADELTEALPDRTDLTDDLAQLGASVDRCRDILRSMGQAGKDDLLLRSAPLEVVLEEAAAPHASRGIEVQIQLAGTTGPVPEIRRDPGIIHALRNLIQNGVDFARVRVQVTAGWSAETISITISDDGPGFSPQMLARVGDPFLTTRPTARETGDYEGMGLGLFIAKTLLERSGGQISFGNGGPGAVIRVTWPRNALEETGRAALGENPKITK